MSIRYLLDTNVVSELGAPAPNRSIVDRLRAESEAIAIAAPTWHEVRYGVERLPPSRKRTALEAYLLDLAADVPVLPYDDRAAAWHATERARLERRGRPVSFVDGQIAAIAATCDLVLVSRNLREMRRFQGLTVESWHR